MLTKQRVELRATLAHADSEPATRVIDPEGGMAIRRLTLSPMQSRPPLSRPQSAVLTQLNYVRPEFDCVPDKRVRMYSFAVYGTSPLDCCGHATSNSR